MKNENKVYELLILYYSFKNMYFRNNPKKTKPRILMYLPFQKSLIAFCLSHQVAPVLKWYPP